MPVTMRKPFTERHCQLRPLITEALDETTQDTLLMLIVGRTDEERFGLSLPAQCDDGHANAGTGRDFIGFRETIKGYGVLLPREVHRHNARELIDCVKAFMRGATASERAL